LPIFYCSVSTFFFNVIPRPPSSTLFPYTTLFRSLVLGQGLALACIGLALGLAASVACTRLLKSMLFEVQPNDPLVYVAVALLLGVVALVARYVPASRSGKIDPAIALRQE